MIRDIFTFIICREILYTYRYFYINYINTRLHLHVPLFIWNKIYLTMGYKIITYIIVIITITLILYIFFEFILHICMHLLHFNGFSTSSYVTFQSFSMQDRYIDGTPKSCRISTRWRITIETRGNKHG